jgi:hypothetical protein
MSSDQFEVLRTRIDACKYLFLNEISEPEENELHVVIEEAKVGGVSDDLVVNGHVITGLRDIESDESCLLCEIVWPTYVAYSVINESYTSWDDRESWEGRLFRTYSRSHFLDYIAKDTFASESYPGPFVHLGIVCLRHILNIVSTAEPRIRMLRE